MRCYAFLCVLLAGALPVDAGYKYMKGSGSRTWYQARDWCKARGWELAKGDGKARAVNHWVYHWFRACVWIGANDIAREGNWRNVDGSSATPTGSG